MKTKRRTNLHYLLIGIAVALAALLASEWDDVVQSFSDGCNGSPYKAAETK